MIVGTDRDKGRVTGKSTGGGGADIGVRIVVLIRVCVYVRVVGWVQVRAQVWIGPQAQVSQQHEYS